MKMVTSKLLCTVTCTNVFVKRNQSSKEDDDILDYCSVGGVIMERWWNVTEKGKTKYMDKNFSQCYFFQNMSHTKWSGIEPELEDIFLACETFHNIVNSTNFAYPTYFSIKFMTAYGL